MRNDIQTNKVWTLNLPGKIKQADHTIHELRKSRDYQCT